MKIESWMLQWIQRFQRWIPETLQEDYFTSYIVIMYLHGIGVFIFFELFLIFSSFVVSILVKISFIYILWSYAINV